MKTPEDVKKFRKEIINEIQEMQDDGTIDTTTAEEIKERIFDIEMKLYPKQLVRDENGNQVLASNYYFGKDFDECE